MDQRGRATMWGQELWICAYWNARNELDNGETRRLLEQREAWAHKVEAAGAEI